MKYDEVLVFGCSWAYGDELPEEHRQSSCFGGLIASYYTAILKNYGMCGGSNISSQWNFLTWLNSEYDAGTKCLVVCSLTEADRTTWFDADTHTYRQSTILIDRKSSENKEVSWDNCCRHYVTHQMSRTLKRLQYQQTVELFNGACSEKDIDLVMFNALPFTDRLMHYPKTLLWPETSMRNCLDSSMIAPMYHPNELGHKYIAETLIAEIERLYGTK